MCRRAEQQNSFVGGLERVNNRVGGVFAFKPSVFFLQKFYMLIKKFGLAKEHVIAVEKIADEGRVFAEKFFQRVVDGDGRFRAQTQIRVVFHRVHVDESVKERANHILAPRVVTVEARNAVEEIFYVSRAACHRLNNLGKVSGVVRLRD